MKNFKMKRIVSLLLALVLTLGAMPFFSTTASAATSGKTGSSTSCYIRIDPSLIWKSGTQYATVKVKTYDGTGWFNTGAKVKFTLYDGNTGRYVTSWVGSGGDTLKLGDDHASYKLTVSAYEKPVTGGIISRSLKGASNFSNIGNAVSWKVENAKNCTIS